MVDFALTPDQLQLQQVAREFAQKEIRPLAAEYDRKTNPDEEWVRDACVGPIYDFTNDMLKVNHILPAIAFSPEI